MTCQQVGDREDGDDRDHCGHHADPHGVPRRADQVTGIQSQGRHAAPLAEPAEQAPVGQRHRRCHQGQADDERADGEGRHRPPPERHAQRRAVADQLRTGAPPGDRPLRRHHDEGQAQKQDRKGERAVLIEQPRPVDGLGERLEPHEVDGAEVADRVEEHQQRSGGDRRADLGNDHPPEHLHRTVAEQARVLLERVRQGAQPGGNRKVDVRVGEQGQDQPGACEAVQPEVQVDADGGGQVVDDASRGEAGQEGGGPDEAGVDERQGHDDAPEPAHRQVGPGGQPCQTGADDSGRRRDQHAQLHGAPERVEGPVGGDEVQPVASCGSGPPDDVATREGEQRGDDQGCHHELWRRPSDARLVPGGPGHGRGRGGGCHHG